MTKANNLQGLKFGRLLVLTQAERRNRRIYWLCRCDCGNDKTIYGGSLTRGATKSCGCLQKQIMTNIRKTHGLSNTRIQRIHSGILSRCRSKTHKQYEDYGGRGIIVCDQWQGATGLQTFLADMGYPPSSKHSIDRIDNDGPYSPENCRWATDKVQTRNTRQNHFIEYNGERLCITEWAEKYGLHPSCLRSRILHLGWDFERAISTPSAGRPIGTKENRSAA